MITGFVGVPGSGKSYEAVLKILENLKLGRKVYTNIDGLDDEHCRTAIKAYCNLTDFQVEVLLNHLDQEETEHFWWHVEKGSLIMLDECHKNFSNRDWNSQKNKEFTEWMSTHRHLGHDVVLITQDIEKIDKHARSLIEYTYLFSKVNFLGGAVNKKYICYTYHGDEHKGTPMAKNIRTYDSKVFACYQTYADSVIKEVGFMKNVNIFKHPVFYAIPVMLCILGYFVSQSSLASGKIFDYAAMAEKNKVKAAEDQSALMPVAPGEEVAKVETVPAGKQVEMVARHIYVYRMSDGTTHLSSSADVPPGGVQVRKI